MTSVKGISSQVDQLKLNASNRPFADVQRTHFADTQQAGPVGSRRDSARSSPVRDREYLQDLCGKLPGSRSSAPHLGGSSDDCQSCSNGSAGAV